LAPQLQSTVLSTLSPLNVEGAVMNHEGSSLLGKSTVILAIVSIVAIALNLAFAHSLHFEPLGLAGFGVFCLGYAMVIPSLSRRRGDEAATVSSTPAKRAPEGRPIIVREGFTRRREFETAIRPCHALTIDLEDYFHTEVASQGVSFSDWEHQPSRIEPCTHRLLELLDRNHTQATFFVLGWVARRYPRLVREIHQRGHEIGCHSLDHQLVSRMSPTQFYESTATAKALIESIVQEPIFGYRAPCFSITPGCEWAFDALAQLGFTYDSSVHPVHHPTYGNPTAPRGAYTVAHDRLMEFPIATWKVAGRNLSVGGGAYLRLLPYQYICRGLTTWEREMQAPAMLYLHPWEIDPYQPYIPLSFQSTVRQTWGTTMMEDKLQRLLTQFRFGPVRDTHKGVLEGKGYSLRKSTFQHAEAVAQVAG
jgi:polysaccharide deacetylase family protein (PEP-CTERM system associated)